MKDNERFTFNNIEVRSNYDDKWLKNSIESPNDFIWINDKRSNQALVLSLKDAEFIENSLLQIRNYIKSNTLQVNNKVTIISGNFKGYKGIITDIDICDNNRPIAVRVIDKDINGTVYANYNQVVKTN
jgi:transcription antitermination factor NusG